MRDTSEALLDTPVMSGYSDRGGPPSETGFSLPPISLKLASSPSNADSDLSSADDYDTHLPTDVSSSYSSRASTFMFSRRSSRLSSSTSSSPTKLPVIDRNKSNSVTSLNSSTLMTSRRSKMRHSFREVRSDRTFANNESDNRASMCKSPSCPALGQEDDTDRSRSEQTEINGGDIHASLHPSIMKQYQGDSMRLPDIFSSNNNSKQKSRRDSSLPPLVGSNQGTVMADALTPRGDQQPERARKARRNSLSGESSHHHTSRSDSYDAQKQASKTSAAIGGGFLVPISESDKITGKQKGSGGKQKSRSKASPRHLRELNDHSLRHASVGINGLLHIEGESVQNGQERLKWEIREEDETMDAAESTCSYDEEKAIDEIAKENNQAASRKNGAGGPKSKKLR